MIIKEVAVFRKSALADDMVNPAIQTSIFCHIPLQTFAENPGIPL
jgi:hypothetical protein